MENSLLPNNRGQFASKAYWDDFFVEWNNKHQSNEAFEWYGTWNDLYPLILRNGIVSTTTNPSVLVIGCGNSDLSENMYSTGFKDTVSIDFSEVVIREMKAKTKNKPGLEFLLMDMLDMEESWAGKYDVVFDKGALDALMGDDGPVSKRQASEMLAEIDRVLKPGGHYLCVTLAQDHVLRQLLEFHTVEQGWAVTIHAFEPADGSALCPFFIDFHKKAPTPAWTLPFSLSSNTDKPITTFDQVVERINEQRFSYQSKRNLPELKKGLRGTFNLASDTQSPVASDQVADARYKISVVDSGLTNEQASIQCGVFVIPQGREHEWVFANEQSQSDIAASNKIARLIFVAMGRGHQFESINAVQDELSATVLDFAQEGLEKDYKMPFLGVGQDRDIGKRTVVFRGESELSGPFVVEDVETTDTVTSKKYIHRRLVFLENASAIQSEIRLVEPAKSRKSGASKAKKAATNPPQAPTPPATGGFPSVFMTEEEMAALSVQDDEQPTVDVNAHLVSDSKFLAFEFHQAMVAALSSVSKLFAYHGKDEAPHVAVIGLGAGSLASFVNRHWLSKFPAVQVDAVDVDAAVVKVAKDYFHFKESTSLRTHVAEGKAYLEKLANMDAPPRLNTIVIDVDSKDLTVPLFCPPAPFLDEGFLGTIKAKLLQNDGCMVINLGARDEETFDAALKTISGVFEQVLVLPVDDSSTINSVVLAIATTNGAWKSSNPHTKVDGLVRAAKDVLEEPISASNILQALNTQESDILEYLSLMEYVDETGRKVDLATIPKPASKKKGRRKKR